MPKGFQKGHTVTKEHREKLSKLLKGNKRWVGRKHTEETKKKMSESAKGKQQWQGKKHTAETRKKMSEWQIGKKHSEETKQKIKEARKLQIISLETREKIGNAQRGEKSHFWQGGKSFEPYPLAWTQVLKRSIRERDNHICKICGLFGNHVHHIDYNKANCTPKNLITLCHSCHSKTNFNRKSWLQYFKENNLCQNKNL